MAMTAQLPGEEPEVLRSTADGTSCSLQDAARAAISQDTSNADSDAQFRIMVASIVERDRKLLDRLAR